MSGLAVRLLALLLVFGAGFLSGVGVESDHRDAQQLAMERSAHEHYEHAVDRNRSIAASISTKLDEGAQERERSSRQFAEALRRARDTGRLAECGQPVTPPGTVAAQPSLHEDGELRLTPEFVRLWNLAIGAPGAPADHPGRPDGHRARADAAGVRPAGHPARGGAAEPGSERPAVGGAARLIARVARPGPADGLVAVAP